MWRLIFAGAFLSSLSTTANAAATFYTDEATWEIAAAAAIGSPEDFDTSAGNLLTASEVSSTPTTDEDLGSSLMFQNTNTGLCASFTLVANEPGAGLVFDDAPAGGAPYWSPPGYLGVGNANEFEDDDFQFLFTANSPYAVSFNFVNANPEVGELLTVEGAGAVTILSVPSTSLPPSGDSFIGIVADEPIAAISFDETPGGDDLAIRDFRFAPGKTGDRDNDGLNDCDEMVLHNTNPKIADTDRDGMSDGFEVSNGFDPLDADENTNTQSDGAEDADGDGLSNASEEAVGSDPNAADTDADGLDDGEEIGTGNFGPPQGIDGAAAGLASLGDVDGDGDADVLAALRVDGQVVWYENTDGMGTYGARQVIASLDEPTSLSGADFDGDGISTRWALPPRTTRLAGTRTWMAWKLRAATDHYGVGRKRIAHCRAGCCGRYRWRRRRRRALRRPRRKLSRRRSGLVRKHRRPRELRPQASNRPVAGRRASRVRGGHGPRW